MTAAARWIELGGDGAQSIRADPTSKEPPMDSTRTLRRPPPDAYDHLWSLLPLYVTFCLLFCVFAGG